MAATVRAGWRGVFLALIFATWPAAAADDGGLVRLATCQDSWLDWQKIKDPKLASVAAYLRDGFSHKPGEPFAVPKSIISLAGFRVLQVYPDSVGMGVGFSVLIDARFDDAKAIFEKKLGKRLQQCETGDGMRNCESQIAEQRTFVLTSGDKPGDAQTLVGCYYYYEK